MDHFYLGNHHRKVTTTSSEAQKYFDLGLNWAYAFNHEAAGECFERALTYDPACAMAHWGIAYSAGPFYNMPWYAFSRDEAMECTSWCFTHLQQAKRLVEASSVIEIALIEALSARIQCPFAVPMAEFDRWDDAYAEAMRGLYKRYPDDFDIVALYIEALILRTPWRLWDLQTEQPAIGADTIEALEACEHAMARADARGWAQHPAILHFHIHILEMSPTPERALQSCQQLGGLCPDSGHLNHMPAHIYMQCDKYAEAVAVSKIAIDKDQRYAAYAGAHNFYSSARSHHLHLMIVACCFLGQYRAAIDGARALKNMLTADVLLFKNKPYFRNALDGYFCTDIHVLVRFGRWHELIAADFDVYPRLYPFSRAIYCYGKALGLATLKDFPAAEQAIMRYEEEAADVPAAYIIHNNRATDVLAVAHLMLRGEYAYHRGEIAQGLDDLRAAVKQCDALNYSEPWPWMHPPRHALAALLLEQGCWQEGEAVYRADLGLDKDIQRCAQNHGNIWSLHGYVECLRARGDQHGLALYEPMLEEARHHADQLITSSCLCRGMASSEADQIDRR